MLHHKQHQSHITHKFLSLKMSGWHCHIMLHYNTAQLQHEQSHVHIMCAKPCAAQQRKSASQAAAASSCPELQTLLHDRIILHHHGARNLHKWFLSIYLRSADCNTTTHCLNSKLLKCYKMLLFGGTTYSIITMWCPHPPKYLLLSNKSSLNRHH